MEALSRGGSGAEVADLLKGLRARGVRLWEEHGRLRYVAPKGVITPRDIYALKSWSQKILAQLRHPTDLDSDLANSRLWYAPLSYTQLARWNAFDLRHRKSLRQIASAIHLQGCLNGSALRESVAIVAAHHDALRTRIVIRDGVPEQQISQASAPTLQEMVITDQRDGVKAESSWELEQCVLETVDVLNDPLVCVRLLKTSDYESLLIVAMEHSIADTMSLSILLRDLFTAYRALDRNELVSLPKVEQQFWAYAKAQKAREQRWLESHHSYWSHRLLGGTGVRFPQASGGAPGVGGWGIAPVCLSSECVAAFRSSCVSRRTTLSLGIFSVFAALILRWSGLQNGVLQFQSNGRFGKEVENTIGFFASALYLRLDLHANDRLADLLVRVTQEYCAAHEHADLSYFEAQPLRPPFIDAVCFNWIPRDGDLSIDSTAHGGIDGGIACRAIPIVEPWLKGLNVDGEPIVLLRETDVGISGGIYFPMSRFDPDSIWKLGAIFERWVVECTRSPDQRLSELELGA